MINSVRPTLSLVVPVYNSALFLNRCIDSILETSFREFEILLINDGSKDQSGDICNGYAEREPRIRAFHQPNSGVAAARNKGIQEASGEWIYFVDSDDWIDRDGLSDLIQTVKDYPEAGVVRCFSREVKDGSTTISSLRPEKEKLFERDDFLKAELLGGYVHSLLVSKKLLDTHKLLFDESLAFGEDLEFTFRCVLNSRKVLVYHKTFYNYVLNEVSYSHRMPLSKIDYLLITATTMNHYGSSFPGDAVRYRSLKLLNNGLYAFFISLSNHQPISEINASAVRRQLVVFFKQNNLTPVNLSFMNGVLALISLVNVKLIVYAYKLMSAAKR